MFQRRSCSALFRFLFASPFRAGKFFSGVPSFYLECLLVVWAGFAAYTIFHRRQVALLQPFLQSGFIVGAFQTEGFAAESRSQQSALKKRNSRGKSSIEINSAQDCFIRVSQKPFFIATTRFFFTGSEPQMIAELQLLGRGINRRSAYEPCQTLGKLSRIPLGKGAAKFVAGNQAQNAIAQKFQTLVIGIVGILAMRTMNQRALKFHRVIKMMTQDRLQLVAFLWGHN